MNLDKRLIKQARASRFFLFLTIVLGFVGGIFIVIQAGLLSRVTNLVFLENQSLDQVSNLLLILLGIIFLRALVVWGSEVFANKFAVRVKTNLRHLLTRHILALGPAFTKGERTGELVNTVFEGIETLDAYFSQYLPGLVLAGLVPLTVLIVVLPIDLLSGLILILTAPLIPIFMILIGNLAQTLTGRQWTSLSHMSAYFLDVLQGLTTLKTLGRSKGQTKVIADVSEHFRIITMSVLRVTFLSALVLEMVATLSTAVIAVEVGIRLLYNRLPFEQAFIILLLAPEFYLPLRMLGARFHAGMSGLEAAKRIFEVLETPLPVNQQNMTPTNDPKSFSKTAIKTNIYFEDVYFEYEDERQALSGISFQIKNGQKVALVGPSGSGKSSIANLLLRFIKPQKGIIRIGDQNIEEIATERWLSNVSWISQNPYLFHGTAADNILMAKPNASTKEMIQAATQAYAHEFINDLPQGYETIIGEQGARLSGGQAQRIALARAFLKDADFIILDEATANLDPETELLLQSALETLLKRKTILMIAHRLNTIRRADQIIVLQEGKVIQKGSHEELVNISGLYQRLVMAYADDKEFIQSTREVSKVESHKLSAKTHNASQFLARSTPQSLSYSSRSYQADEKGTFSDFIRLLKFVAPFSGFVGLAVFMGFATIASGIGLMTTSAYIISAAALQPSIADLQVAIVGVRFFGIARGIFRYLERYTSHQVTFRLLAKLRIWFYQSLEPLAPARLMLYRSGDLLTRILGDIESLENFYVRVLAPPLVAFIVAITMFFFMARFNPLLGQVQFTMLIGAGLFIPLITRLLSRNPGQQAVLQRTNLNSETVDFIQGMADLVVFGQASKKISQIDALSQQYGRTQHQMAKIFGLQSGFISLISNLGLWVILIITIPLVHAGKVDGVFLAVLSLAALTSFEAITPLPLAAQYLESNLQSARRLYEVVDAEPEVQDPASTIAVPKKFDLAVKNISFHYPLENTPLTMQSEYPAKWVLREISFNILRGQRIAIVGPSGAGKSTLVNLLLRFWDYHDGAIHLNEHDFYRYAQDELRRSIAVVSQNTYLFNASVRDNLRIANPKARDEQVILAAKSAQIHKFIQTLPQGYDTWVGEQGMRLSGGERQRIAIARALLKDSPFLILDEATANLDALTERQVLKTIHSLFENRMVLMITHRLAGMESMDELLVLNHGRLVERGNHTGLVQADGFYRRMWELQNQVMVL